MPDKMREPDNPDTLKSEKTTPESLSDVVKKTLRELAEWQEVTRRMQDRNRTSQIKPAEEPQEIIS